MDNQKLIEDLQIAFYTSTCVGVVLGSLRYIYNRLWDYRKLGQVVEDMATIHLPYLYSCVSKIGTALGVAMDDAPNVTFPRLKTPPKRVNGHDSTSYAGRD